MSDNLKCTACGWEMAADHGEWIGDAPYCGQCTGTEYARSQRSTAKSRLQRAQEEARRMRAYNDAETRRMLGEEDSSLATYGEVSAEPHPVFTVQPPMSVDEAFGEDATDEGLPYDYYVDAHGSDCPLPAPMLAKPESDGHFIVALAGSENFTKGRVYRVGGQYKDDPRPNRVGIVADDEGDNNGYTIDRFAYATPHDGYCVETGCYYMNAFQDFSGTSEIIVNGIRMRRCI